MVYFLLGLIFLVFPFLILSFFKDKKTGFVYILFFWVLFQTFLATTTQLFGIFYFWIIFFVNFLVFFIIACFLIKKNKKEGFNFKEIKIDWMIIFVVLISVLSLYQVHYNYTGKINFAADQGVLYHNVKNMVYPYPYFSDEWDAVSLIKYSIDSHTLPFKNPLDNNFYMNFAAPFYSFLSGLALLLKVDPLLSFNFFSIFINTLIIVMGYFFLRLNKIPKVISGISALFLLYIPSAANLPGMWHLMPIHMGIVFSLIGFCFMSLDKTKMAILSAFLVLIFYPPLILFYGLALLVFLIYKIKTTHQLTKKVIWYSSAGLPSIILAIFLFYLFAIYSPKFSKISDIVFSRLFYPSFTGSYIPQYNFYNIIPALSLLFFIFGIYYVFKNFKWLFSQIVLGAAFWILYSFIVNRIIIDYERVVFFTSIIVILASAFGLKIICNYIDSRWRIKYLASNFLKAGFIIFFVLFLPFYTSQNNWQKFISINPANGAKAFPKAPANNYLVEDDIKIFKDIEQKKFLSIPWKGLVIGVATNNYPVVAKNGIISVGSVKTLYDFMNSNCENKIKMAKKNKIDYIYINFSFICPGIEKIDKSRESFILYKVGEVL